MKKWWLGLLKNVCVVRPHDDVIKWTHFLRYWPFVRGIHRSPVNSPHKGQWCGALVFSLICTWTKGWINIGEAGDLRRHRAHYDVIRPIWVKQYLWDTFHNVGTLAASVIDYQVIGWDCAKMLNAQAWFMINLNSSTSEIGVLLSIHSTTPASVFRDFEGIWYRDEYETTFDILQIISSNIRHTLFNSEGSLSS